MTIDEIKSHKIFRHQSVIDLKYQLINWHQLLSIDIDYHWLSVSSIDYNGILPNATKYMNKFDKRISQNKIEQVFIGRSTGL